MTSTAKQMQLAHEPQARERLLRIGEVVRRLVEEFPDISISKIRYLEDEGLLTPRRTQGGYRLFSEADLERLQTILRLQRDEFLPLRVIKDELDAPGQKERKRRKPTALGAEEETSSTISATAPASIRGSRRSSRTSACSPRTERAPTSAIPSPTRTSPRPARSLRASASTRGTCGPSAPRPAARLHCSSSSSRRRSGRAATSAAHKACMTCSSSPS
jgi:DNA-binding transcriptional MerR regulator